MMEIANGRPHGRPDDRLCKGRLLPEVAVPDQASGISARCKLQGWGSPVDSGVSNKILITRAVPRYNTMSEH